MTLQEKKEKVNKIIETTIKESSEFSEVYVSPNNGIVCAVISENGEEIPIVIETHISKDKTYTYGKIKKADALLAKKTAEKEKRKAEMVKAYMTKSQNKEER